MTTDTIFSVDLADPAIHANPYPTYARMRREAPVMEVKGRGYMGKAWLVTRYNDVVAVLKDPRFINDRRNLAAGGGDYPWWMPRAMRVMASTIVSLDDPAHARIKSLVHKAFTPRMIEGMGGRVERIANELLDRAEKKGTIDLVAEFALPLPLQVIAEMLGVPEKELPKFRHYIRNLLDAPPSNLARLVTGIRNNRRMIRYLEGLIALRRAEPDEGLITALVMAEQAGDRLTGDELTSLIFVLLLAGHETTVNLIGNGTLALLENRDQLALLRSDPALVKSAVEELLRYTNPVEHGVMRFAREDVELSGVTIPTGDTVVALLSSANRDETIFENAEKLNIARDPNRHVAFGIGMHFCLGAPLARMEGAIAFNALVQRFPGIRLAVAPEEIRWRSGAPNFRGLKSLPVHLGSGSRSTVAEHSIAR
jgi:cytochrome P450